MCITSSLLHATVRNNDRSFYTLGSCAFAASNAELSTKMASYAAHQKTFIKTFYFSAVEVEVFIIGETCDIQHTRTVLQ
jgi:hypothetical protein